MNLELAKAQFRNYRNLPYRKYQAEAVEYIVSSQKRFVFLEAPTGSGKSLIAMVAGMMKKGVTYSVHSKVLQNQITVDFPEARSLFGRANYPCVEVGGLTCDECFHSKGMICPSKHTRCVYDKEKQKVLGSTLRILNYDYLLTEANYVGKFSGSLFNIVDEADNLENTLIGFVALTFTTFALKRLGMEYLAEKLKQTSKDKTELLNSWINFGVTGRERVMRVVIKIRNEIENIPDANSEEVARKLKELSRVERLLGKINLFLDNVDSTWILDNSQEDKYTFRPLWLTINLSEKFLWAHAKQWVLMSATFLPIHLEAKRLGIPLDEVDYKSIPSTFPVERRPVHIVSAADLTAKTMDAEIPKVVKAVKKIVDSKPDVKGLIHAVSYKLADALVKGVNSPRLLVHNSTNRQEVLDRFMESDEPPVH